MKHPLETLLSAAGILLLALLSCLLLPAPSLGLTLAQSFVLQHQGTIECLSRPGYTCFTVRLPLGVPENRLPG